MRHAPSPSPPRASGNRPWLAWPGHDAADGANGCPGASAEPGRPAIDSRIMARSSWSFMNGHRIDNADDRRVHRRSRPAERIGGGAPFKHDQHLLVHPGANAVDGEQGVAARRVVEVQRLDQKQLRAFEPVVLLRRHDGADHSRELHHSSTSHLSTMPTIPASTGGSAGKKGKLASLPRTKNTSSPAPAPTASTATRGRPAGWRSADSGCTSSSVSPVRLSSLRVATTLPITLPNCIWSSNQPHLVIESTAEDAATFAHGYGGPPSLQRRFHSSISTASTIPTIAASTGQSFIPDAIRAELPLTISTVSPTPASTVSTATSGAPSTAPRGSIGRATSSLLLTRRGSLRVATTVPTTFARSTLPTPSRSTCRSGARLRGWHAGAESRAPTPARRRAAPQPRPRRSRP